MFWGKQYIYSKHQTLILLQREGQNAFYIYCTIIVSDKRLSGKQYRNIKVKIKSLHGALHIYISKGSMLRFFLTSFFGVLLVLFDTGYLR